MEFVDVVVRLPPLYGFDEDKLIGVEVVAIWRLDNGADRPRTLRGEAQYPRVKVAVRKEFLDRLYPRRCALG
jgi:hypothetical protein